MIIAIIGASGSGKTTIISHLKQWKFFKKSRVIVKDEDNFLILNFLKSIFGNKLFNEYKQQKFFNKAPQSLTSQLFSGVAYWLYPAIIYLEFLITHILYSTIWRNQVLICDRYLYDYLVTFEEMLNIRSPIMNFLVIRFPKPHLCFYLQISKKISLARNKNNIPGKITSSSDLHERVLRRYNSLAHQLAMIKVRGDQNKFDAVEEIEDYIYNKEKLMQIKSLSVSGIDGAGKTTTCNNIHRLCRQLNIPSAIVHFYHLSILYKFLNRMGTKDIPSSNMNIQNQSFLWALLTFIDSYIQYIFARITNLGSLIIYDRYFYDYLVSFEYRKIPLLNSFTKLIPEPCRSFVFFIKPAKAHRRKTDNLKAGYFQEMHHLYIKLAKQQKLIPIQVSNKSPKEVLRKVIEVI